MELFSARASGHRAQRLTQDAQPGKELIVNLPTRTLREHPDLDQLKRQAKELLAAFQAAHPDAIAEVNAHYRGSDAGTFALHDAQLVLARAQGFESWPKLKAYVEGITEKRLLDAVTNGDLEQVRAMLKVRPEIAKTSGALHRAVLDHAPEMVRLLMEHGANAREGVYPHRDATSPLTMAADRGYDEITAIIEEAEHRRRQARSGQMAAPAPDPLFRVIASVDDERTIAMMEANPALIQTCHPVHHWTPLHVAASRLNAGIAGWLLEHGARPCRSVLTIELRWTSRHRGRPRKVPNASKRSRISFKNTVRL